MILLLDNYDSFTWNLYDYLAQTGKQVEVWRNDACTLQQIETLNPEAIVISPGPKTPMDAGITMQMIESFHHRIPMLGICLGYQALGIYFGASLVKSVVPMHGKTSLIQHNQDIIFSGIQSPMQVMRYHSLNIADISAMQLEVIAQTISGEPMAIKHCHFPLYGFLFHPESILTSAGKLLLHNWSEMLPVIK
ncbi:MAG: aminodeoxychorismate/anthranilate synthase component II [Bacteroidetes bacterium]|nr:aminodeoxychorismate/anthranilate synthase component II [Bacteroidota bacterium]MBP7398148.1 aminodeoxychorismate/anthranilate synthase component II [Chitinophagales bacterium]MBK7108144.1 aminodeoxychorismate/anthranilate synthase component II [Bacteroidota bacterium]MBK8486423.1 aminodeoxychorismate/anthranilate synthase component II [Bacteroidota bacterium]MBK8683203.1 aminodeoxychorismate/anthranilate synthase component II [Bacteroidota bacterium]